MKVSEFKSQCQEIYKKHFPNAYFKISKLALGDGICISCGLIENIEDQTSKLRDNDPMRILLFIHNGIDAETDNFITDKIIIEGENGSLCVNPVEKYFAMSRVKIPFRKINNTPEKALQSLDKFFKKAKTIVQEQRDNNNIYHQSIIKNLYLYF